MPKKILTLIILVILSFSSCASTVLESSEPSITESSEVIELKSNKSFAEYDDYVFTFCNALINKDREVINTYMNSTDEFRFIDDVDFKSYEIISGKDKKPFKKYGREDVFSEYDVTFDVSKSNDDRFPVGKSKWKLCFTDGISPYCYYFIPEINNQENIYETYFFKNNCIKTA